jgi:hypothetical protein
VLAPTPYLSGYIVFVFSSPISYTGQVPEEWCTVTVTDAEGRRHSVDLLAASTYDAAHIFVTHAKTQQGAGLPRPTLATVFEVVINGKVHRVEGAALQRWIVKERSERKGPRGLLFSRRATLE